MDTERAGACDSCSRKRHVEMRGFKPDGTAFQSLRQTALVCVVKTGQGGQAHPSSTAGVYAPDESEVSKTTLKG